MSWVPFSGSLTASQDRFNNLPKVICGPIVRRVEKNSVSIFFVLKVTSTDVRLKIYEDGVIGTPYRDNSDFNEIQLGENLFAVMVTWKTNLISEYLTPGTKYFYDVYFGAGTNLSSSNILSVNGGISDITYGPDVLPSFLVPPLNVSDFKIAHGSCRKTHGQCLDALRGVDEMITKSYNEPSTYKRPHILMMSGDQIYSDDVPDPLLFMLIDAGKKFVNDPWDDNLNYPTQYTRYTCPGYRGKLLVDVAKFQTEEPYCKSHLIHYPEFCMMYLFVWSDVLWPDVLPDVEDANILAANWYGSNIKYVDSTKLDDDIYQDSEYEHKDLKDSFDAEAKEILAFKSTLSRVRKALANVPVYMMFDDHEITDDWFLNLDWMDAIEYPNTNLHNLSKHLITTGLMAYTVFQGWGNMPERFSLAGTEEHTLLVNLQAFYAAEKLAGVQAASMPYVDIRTAILPTLTTSSSIGESMKLISNIRWNYIVNFYNNYQLVVLDERTKRGYPKGDRRGATSRISEDDMDEQLGVGITAPPVSILVCPAPLFGVRFLSEFVEWITPFPKSHASNDYEQWEFNKYAHNKFLEKLTFLRNVVVLSGDVHFGTSFEVKYWHKTLGELVIAQFTASAFKNEEFKTRDLAALTAWIDKKTEEDQGGKVKLMGWWDFTEVVASTPILPLDIVLLWGSADYPVIINAEGVFSIADEPAFELEIKIISDTREFYERSPPQIPQVPSSAESWLKFLRYMRKYDSYRVGIGHNNMAGIDLNFSSSSALNNKASQSTWFSFDDPEDVDASILAGAPIYPSGLFESNLSLPAPGDKPSLNL